MCIVDLGDLIQRSILTTQHIIKIKCIEIKTIMNIKQSDDVENTTALLCVSNGEHVYYEAHTHTHYECEQPYTQCGGRCI